MKFKRVLTSYNEKPILKEKGFGEGRNIYDTTQGGRFVEVTYF